MFAKNNQISLVFVIYHFGFANTTFGKSHKNNTFSQTLTICPVKWVGKYWVLERVTPPVQHILGGWRGGEGGG